MVIKWWKYLTIILIFYSIIAGFLVPVPAMDGRLAETARNLFYHVPMWFGMMILFTLSVYYAVIFLKTNNMDASHYSASLASVGLWMGLIGIITGAVWAKFQWGSAWSGDPKQNGAAIALLMYLAYFIIRQNLKKSSKIHRLSAIYNIFAFCMLFPTIWILPRLQESLHPGGLGEDGNPGLNPKDLDANLRLVFYPAIAGFTLLGLWVSKLHYSFLKLKYAY
ncbi:MAG: cytochrome c biogenesis protein CcsA [Alphaproteobacteria bacterium]|nr:cytochrome c biogenesis protein CcsA [Alphaproteobacteria bacterium]